jgi:hypothetical protein
MRVTFRVLRLSAGNSPGEYYQAQALAAKIWRQDQKPGDDIATSDLATQRSEEISITDAAIRAENRLSDVVDQDRHDCQAQKKQSGE